jgi:hypothetical protein
MLMSPNPLPKPKLARSGAVLETLFEAMTLTAGLCAGADATLTVIGYDSSYLHLFRSYEPSHQAIRSVAPIDPALLSFFNQNADHCISRGASARRAKRFHSSEPPLAADFYSFR